MLSNVAWAKSKATFSSIVPSCFLEKRYPTAFILDIWACESLSNPSEYKAFPSFHNFWSFLILSALPVNFNLAFSSYCFNSSSVKATSRILPSTCFFSTFLSFWIFLFSSTTFLISIKFVIISSIWSCIPLALSILYLPILSLNRVSIISSLWSDFFSPTPYDDPNCSSFRIVSTCSSVNSLALFFIASILAFVFLP